MTEIYIVRHTQAEGNSFRMMQGHWDGDITFQGLKQIDALSERFKNIHVDTVFSSDLYRAYVTAEALSKFKNLKINLIKEFREIDVGPWEAQFFGNVIYKDPERSNLFMFDAEKWILPGAETFADVKKRSVSKLIELCQKNEGKTIAIVSHGITIRCLISSLFDIPLDDINRNPICGNTAVSKLFYNNDTKKFTIGFLNDTSHLGDLSIKKWNLTHDLRDDIFNPYHEPDFYKSCYTEAWKFAHRDISFFNAEPYLRSAENHSLYYPRAILKLFDGDEAVGILDMDTERGKDEGYGWISLLYLMPEYRLKGYGIQVLARAIQEYRKIGRNSIRLSVNEENDLARRFYEKNGFDIIKNKSSMTGNILTMERRIGGRIACLKKR